MPFNVTPGVPYCRASVPASRDANRPRRAALKPRPVRLQNDAIYVCDNSVENCECSRDSNGNVDQRYWCPLELREEPYACLTQSFVGNMPAGMRHPANKRNTKRMMPPCGSCGKHFPTPTSPNARNSHASRCRRKRQQVEHHATVPVNLVRMWKTRGFHVFGADQPSKGCQICFEAWSATCVRNKLPCGCARLCVDCAKRCRAEARRKKPMSWSCPFGCGAAFGQKYRP